MNIYFIVNPKVASVNVKVVSVNLKIVLVKAKVVFILGFLVIMYNFSYIQWLFHNLDKPYMYHFSLSLYLNSLNKPRSKYAHLLLLVSHSQ